MCWVEIFRALLTPLIAIIALGIGYQQLRTNRDKVRLDLFERRLSGYEVTSSLLVAMHVKCEVDSDQLTSFWNGTNKSQFLFGEDVNEYLKKLTEKATLLAADSNSISREIDLTKPQKAEIGKRKLTPSLSRLANEQNRLEELFEPYLHFET